MNKKQKEILASYGIKRNLNYYMIGIDIYCTKIMNYFNRYFNVFFLFGIFLSTLLLLYLGIKVTFR